MYRKLVTFTHARDAQPIAIHPERVISVICPRKHADEEAVKGMVIVQEGYAAPIGAVVFLDGGPSRGIPVVEDFGYVVGTIDNFGEAPLVAG